ncbi:Protein TIFY 9 [Acorus gramineus]|uniref:Protein TIFY n=1 Tax=Acorus gramineus TaxID=55184 RepID=A0AAV9B6E6_ACOGR|nr:Protein TIFY 9 [Acorus gramineus]
MTTRAPIELDFLGIESRGASRFPPRHHQRKPCVREIQNAITRLDPHLIRKVISSGSADGWTSPEFVSPAPTPTPVSYASVHRRIGSFGLSPPSPSPATADAKRSGFLSQLPVCNPDSRRCVENSLVETPLTIFYNGTVSVFDVSLDSADKILKMAEDMSEASDPNRDDEQLNGEDLPIARRRSLRRFLEKRKERLTCVSPYDMGASVGNGTC